MISSLQTDRGSNNTSKRGRTSSDGESSWWCISSVRTGGVLDTTEVALHPDTHGVVRVGQLEALRVVVVEGEHLAGHSSKVL